MDWLKTDQSTEPKEGASAQNTAAEGTGAPSPDPASGQNNAASQGRELHTWENQLRGDLRKLDITADIPTLNDLVEKYRDSSEKLGRALVPPGEGSKPEDWDNVFTKLGRPDKPEGYKVSDPNRKGVDEKLIAELRTLAHNAKLTQLQFDALLPQVATSRSEKLAKQEEAKVKAEAELKQAWGKVETTWGTEELATRKSIAQQAMKQNLGDRYDDMLKWIEDNQYGKDPRFLEFVYLLGKKSIDRGVARGSTPPVTQPSNIVATDSGNPRPKYAFET